MSGFLKARVVGTCPTGKRRFPTQLDAGIALGKAQAVRSVHPTDRVEVRHYHCQKCQGHHLTSMPRR